MAQCMHPSSPTQSDVSNSDRRKIYLSQQQKHLINQSKQSNDKCIATPGDVCDPIKSLVNGWPDFSTSTMKENLKKRKCDSIPTLKVEEGKCNKRVKEDDNKIRNEDKSEKCEKVKKGKNKKESENSNSTVTPKQDYIHVRARRGQATDSHSLAERVRRERISERMRHLQELVPGCNKVTGKAGMLDEIINYVQSLQRQVEFLSMKLASVNPMVEIDIEDLLHRQMNLPNDQLNATFLQFNPCFGIEMANNMEQPNGLNLNPIFNGSMPDQLVDPFLNVNGSDPNWEAGLQNLYGSDLNLVKNLGFSFQ